MSDLPTRARWLRSRGVAAVAISSAVATAVVGLRVAGAFEPLELAIYDRQVTFRSALGPATAPRGRVALVEYTEEDIQTQRRFPLSDHQLSRVLEVILEGGPRVVGVDFYRDVPIPPGSEQLHALLEREPRVIMIHRFGGEDQFAVPPPPAVRGTDRVGFSDLVLDPDGSVRRGLLFQEDEEFGPGLSLALRVALGWLAYDAIGLELDPEDESLVRIGPTPLGRLSPNTGGYSRADAGGYQYMLDFEAAPPLDRVSVSQLLAGDVDPDLFRDRAVFVGVTAQTHADLIRVSWGAWPGVFIHGQATEQLLRFGLGEAHPQRVLPEGAEWAWILLCSLLGGLLALRARSVWGFALLAGSGGVGIVALGFAVLTVGWWIPTVPAALAGLTSAAIATAYVSRDERAQRALLMQLFSRHLDPKIASDIWERRDEFLAGGRPRPQRLTATVLFADVKDSTALGEKLDALAFMDWINDFMDAMAVQVHAHGGFVDDYFGDGLKADFGVPLPRHSDDEVRDDACAAVIAALAMQRRLEGLNREWTERGLPRGSMRVGICTGAVVAGSVGDRDRLKYTLVGDVVNTAARLESLDTGSHDFQRSPCRILVAGSTAAHVAASFDLRPLGEHVVKGKGEAVAVFEVLGPEAGAGA